MSEHGPVLISIYIIILYIYILYTNDIDMYVRAFPRGGLVSLMKIATTWVPIYEEKTMCVRFARV